jgi:hypothetical protein
MLPKLAENDQRLFVGFLEGIFVICHADSRVVTLQRQQENSLSTPVRRLTRSKPPGSTSMWIRGIPAPIPPKENICLAWLLTWKDESKMPQLALSDTLLLTPSIWIMYLKQQLARTTFRWPALL